MRAKTETDSDEYDDILLLIDIILETGTYDSI